MDIYKELLKEGVNFHISENALDNLISLKKD